MQSSEPAFQVTKHGRPYKPGSVMRALIVPLTAVLNHAATQGYCDPPHFLRPRYNDRRVRYGTTDECSRLLAASAPHAAAFWLFAMFIGDRISESLNLQIEDVYLENSWAVFSDTKNDTHRGVALHTQIVELLRVIIGDRNAGYVFLTDEGLPYETTPKKARYAACERARIKNFRIHDLRHTFATNLLVAGVDVRFAEKQMGHAGKNAMNSRYAYAPTLSLSRRPTGSPALPSRSLTIEHGPDQGMAALSPDRTKAKRAGSRDVPRFHRFFHQSNADVQVMFTVFHRLSRLDLTAKTKEKRGFGRVAQRESTPFTRVGSQVQSLSRPPVLSTA